MADDLLPRGARDRLVSFFYLLTRGTPGVDGMGWGSVKELLREACKGDGESVFTSEGGELLAREIVHELLTGERQSRGSTAALCPTCDDARPERCCGCDEPIPREAQRLRPCPYASEIDGDEDRHLLCENCYGQRLDDI